MARTHSSKSIPYTAAPIKLILSDLALWARITFVLPPAGIFSIIFPIGPFNSGSLDELYPSVANLWSLALQLVLSLSQLVFFLSLIPSAFGIVPPWISGYTPAWLAYVIGFILATRYISRLILNGYQREYLSTVGVSTDETKKFTNEKWIFVNGVAAGQHWMQSNLDRLSLTFKREIEGIHNETRGIIFDLVECILERTLGWATPSTRTVYAKLLGIVSDDAYERVILILHSQGAIEGGLALDWLFATVPASLLKRVEVYTFGSAANHFNNPSFEVIDPPTDTTTTTQNQDQDQDGRILRYIEHYANDMDYVSQFGILNFRPRSRKRTTLSSEDQNMYAGRLFIRHGYGHQFNNNYLDNLLTLNAERTKVEENNVFMDSTLDENLLDDSDIVVVKGSNSRIPTNTGIIAKNKTSNKTSKIPPQKIKDVSRLWTYRNGGVPED